MRRSSLLPALVSAAALLMPAASQAGVGVTPPPPGARVVTFDDVAAPVFFYDATALRRSYAPLGIVFEGSDEKNGGAILNDTSNFGVVGYSAPNFLAFNSNPIVSLSDGGKPAFPQTIRFLKPVKQVQFSAGSSTGGQVTAKAYNAKGEELDTNTLTLNPQMSTVFLFGAQITRIEVTSSAELTVIDDVSFLLDRTLIDFDDVTASPFFSENTALRDRYAPKAVSFAATGTDNGGAILNAFAFPISGISSPNALAFNSEQALADGGTPKFPFEMLFAPPVSHVEFLAGAVSSASITATAFDYYSNEVATTTVEIGPNMQKVELDGPGITWVQVDSTAVIGLIDDLAFEVEGTLIDFDDADTAPCCFIATDPLRERYAGLGVHFLGAGPADGAAILSEEGDFEVTGYSGRNFLAYNPSLSYLDGGISGLPQTILFDRPMKRVEFRAGSKFELSRLDVEVFDALDQSAGTSTLYLKPGLQSVITPGEGIRKIVVASAADYGVIDDLGFQPEDPCAHDPCAYGEALDRACSFCVAEICAADSDCCFDGWGTSCAKAVDTVCSQTCDPICGDANDDRRVTTTDALIALKTAVGTSTCGLERCDYAGGGSVKSGDALAILKAAVGQSVPPKCPLVK